MNINNSLSHRRQEPESKTLYVVGTPIGNLNDFSFRALNVLKNVSLIACEDTRQTKKLMNRFEISNNLISFNKHNFYNKISSIIDALNLGKSVALVSDAGLPCICDPGEELVKEAKIKGFNITAIPGPCAALTALISSGLPSSKFTFEGFLPKKKKEREKILLEISNNENTTILYESPYRINKLLKELKEYCGGDREIEVFRELTKLFEENIGNNIDKVLGLIEGKETLGEFTLVIKGSNKKNKLEFQKLSLKKELEELINAGLSLSAASKYLSKKNNISKSKIYNLY